MPGSYVRTGAWEEYMRKKNDSCRYRQKVRWKYGLSSAVLLTVLLILSGCGEPEAGTVYEPANREENLYIDLTALEAEEEIKNNRELPEAEITDSGYTVSEIDESDVYPPKKTDSQGNRLPAYMVNFAVRISNKGNDSAMVFPTVIAKAKDMNGDTITSYRRTIRTYILPDEEIVYAGDMIVRGEKPSDIRFSAECDDPEDFYPTEEELRMPRTDSYSASDVTVEVLEEYKDKAPSAGRESSEGLAKGYFLFGELPVLSGKIRCNYSENHEAFVTILFKNGENILGGETGRVMIPRGKEAFFSFSSTGPLPEGTDNYEVGAFPIAGY